MADFLYLPIIDPSREGIMSVQTTLRKLTAQDRCDRCSAPAKTFVKLRHGGELLFCNHHANKHKSRLEADGAKLHGFVS